MRPRRRIHPVAAAAVTAAALAACGSGGGGGAAGGGGPNGPGGAKLEAAPVCSTVSNPDTSGALPSAPDPSVSGTVTLWGWYDLAPEATTDLLAKFYPNVKVKFVDYSLEDTPVKLQTALNAGTGAPDLAMIEDKTLPTVWNNGLYDLSDCLKPYQADFPAFKWSRIQRPDGTLTAAPWEINPGFVTYRRDVFAKYGIDPSTITTWDQFQAAGRKVVQQSDGKVKWTLSNTVETGNGTENLLGDTELLVNQSGGKLFDKDGKPAFDSPNNVAVLQLLKKFRDEGLTLNDVPSKQAELTALRNGTVATFIGEASSRFFLSSALKDTAGKWGILELPAFTDGGTRGAVNGGTSIVMTDQSKNTPAAWAFLKIWLLTVDGRYQSFQAGQLVENLFLPAAKDPRFNQPDPFYGGDRFLQKSIQSAQAAPPFPSSAQLPKLENSIQSQLPAFLSGKKTAEQLASTAQAAAGN